MKDRILSYMQDYQRRYGENPRMEDIGEAMGTPNRSHIYYYLKQMESEGLVSTTRPPNFARRFQAIEGSGYQEETGLRPTGPWVRPDKV